MARRSVRMVAAGLAAGAMLGAAVAPASAWPLPLTPEDVRLPQRGARQLPRR